MIKHLRVSFRTLVFFTKIMLISSIFSTIFAQEQNADHFTNKQNIKASLSSDPQLEVTRSGLWSAMMDFIVEGEYVYCAMINGVMILDISDIENPRLFSQLFLNDITWRIAKSGEYLYVTTRESGLKIISVADPNNPSLIKTITLDSHPQGVLGNGNILFVPTLTSLNVLNVSDPAHPQVIGNLLVPGFIYFSQFRLKFSGNFLFVAAGDLWIFDVSDFENPVLVSQVEVPHNAVDLELSDTLLFLLERTSVVPAYTSSLTIVDINKPDSPYVVNRNVMPGGFYSFEIDSQYAYISAGESGILVLDISTPDSATTAGCFPSSGITGYISLIDGRILSSNNIATFPDDLIPYDYCSNINSLKYSTIDNSGDFQIIDFLNPQEPAIIGIYKNPGLTNLVASFENCLFVASSDSTVKILDANETNELTVLASIEIGEVTDLVALEEKLVCVGSAGLSVISTSTLNAPNLIGSLPLPPFPFGVAANGNLAIVCAGSYGIGLVDISCPDSLELLSTLSTPDFAIDALIDGNYAYIADRYSGLQVVDISNPTEPLIVSSFPGPGQSDWIIYLAQSDNILYAAGGGYVYSLDVSDPLSPNRIGTYPATSGIRSLNIIDNYLTIAATDGVELVSITEPSNLTKVDYLETPGFAMSITHVANRLQVADIYGLIEMRFDITTGIGDHEIDPEIPKTFELYQNYPNPFNPTTTIEFALTRKSEVKLLILNILGQQIVTLLNKQLSPGHHRVVWDGTDSYGNKVASGVYFYTLLTNETFDTRKMLLLK